MSAPNEIEAKPSEDAITKPDNNAQIAENTGDSHDYYEMYYDQTHKAPYYYHPKTGASVWSLPKGAICADMTEGNLEKINKSFLQEEEEEEKEPTEHQKKKIEIEELKKK